VAALVAVVDGILLYIPIVRLKNPFAGGDTKTGYSMTRDPSVVGAIDTDPLVPVVAAVVDTAAKAS
jgi:hypothetical protein